MGKVRDALYTGLGAFGLLGGLARGALGKREFRCTFPQCDQWANYVDRSQPGSPGGFVCKQHKRADAAEIDALRFIARTRRQPLEQVIEQFVTSSTVEE